MKEEKDLKTEGYEWDLSCFYNGIDDPQIDKDIKESAKRAKSFCEKYKGNLSTQLGKAIEDYVEIDALMDNVHVYLLHREALDLQNEVVKTKLCEAQDFFNNLCADYLVFFEVEIMGLSDDVIKSLSKKNAIVKDNLVWLKKVRLQKPHKLEEEVEKALIKRASYGSGSWSDFFAVFLSDIKFPFNDKEMGLEEILNIFSNDKNKNTRAKALGVLNKVLGERFAKFSAQTLNMVVGSKRVEDKERGYPHSMSARNKANKITDEVVEALHRAVTKEAAPLIQKYYRLKANLLGVETLKWSDRNAPMPFVDKDIVPFDKAIKIVLDAYDGFSPTLGALVRRMISEKMIDAPVKKGKDSGAFNCTTILPGGKSVAYTFLNYLGSKKDVMTLAHELGHGVHGLLATEAQGPLKYRAPIAYCETASIFGEMITFDYLRQDLMSKGLKDSSQESIKKILALYMSKIDSMINTCVRQISFSNFERKVHGAGRRLSVEELKNIWIEVTKELYGEEGDVFTYKDIEYLWCYIPHFHRPFYVYGYASGELFTQSIYAQRSRLGERFEPLYLDILRAGGTKDAVGLLKPMGLDPKKPQFWVNGIKNSFGKMIEEAEMLSKRII